MITIAYMTNRLNCRIEWFFDSLIRQAGHDYPYIRVVVVDFHADKRGDSYSTFKTENVFWTTPKPTVWQGKHRLTRQDYFAAANARNTAICYAPDGYVAFVDDLSVLMPGWMDCVRDAVSRPEITLGRYRKVKNLVVKEGVAESYEEFQGGEDSRYQKAHGDRLIRCPGNWLYGCSFVAPVEALLKINGMDEDNDSMGAEDTAAGVMLERQNYGFIYDQRMLTLESEELHHIEKPFLRISKPYVEGVSNFRERDAAHEMVRMLNHGRHMAPNYVNLRELRQTILNGGEFPVSQVPDRDWRDGQLLSEM